MTFFDTVKGTVNTAADTISNVTQNIVEKNRTNAKLNRLRLIMKCESELMNRAYIALGKSFYENTKKGESVSEEQQKKLFEVIKIPKLRLPRQESVTVKLLTVQTIFFTVHPKHSRNLNLKTKRLLTLQLLAQMKTSTKVLLSRHSRRKRKSLQKKFRTNP